MPKASTFALRLATQMIDSDTFPMLTNAGENIRLPVSEARALVGPGWSATVNAYNEDEVTDELKIQAAIVHAPGIGAERVFVPSSMFPYDASLITFDPAIQMVREGGADWTYWDVQAYGASPDGTTDTYAALTAAIAGLPSIGGILYFPEGTYYISGSVGIVISAKSNITIRGPGLIYAPNIAASNYIIQVKGSNSGVSTTVSVAVVRGDTDITVTDGSVFTAGQMAMVQSTEAFSVVDTSYKKSELVFIESVASNVLTLTQGMKLDYATGGQTITITRLVRIDNITIADLELRGGGASANQFGLGVAYAVNTRVNSCKISDCETVGFAAQWCDNATFRDCTVLHANRAATGYAYQFDNMTQNSGVVDCYAEDFRHAFTVGSSYVVWNYTVRGCRFVGNAFDVGAIETHMNSANGSIIGNVVADSFDGIASEGPGTLIVGNLISGGAGTGIILRNEGCTNAHIEGNLVHSLGGIALDPSTVADAGQNVTVVANKLIGEVAGGLPVTAGISVTSDNTKIRANEIIGFSPGIVVQGDYPTISDNDIQDTRDGANPYGIRLVPSASMNGAKITNNRIFSKITSEMTFGIYAETGTTDAVIEGNHIDNFITASLGNAGTRTRIKRNFISGVRQRTAVLGTTVAGLAAGTTNGRVKTVNTVVCEINGLKYSFTAADPYWNVTGVTTTAGQFRKVLLCIATSGVGDFFVGRTAATQAAAEIPDWPPYNYAVVGFVEIPNSYTDGDSLAGEVFVDFLGAVE